MSFSTLLVTSFSLTDRWFLIPHILYFLTIPVFSAAISFMTLMMVDFEIVIPKSDKHVTIFLEDRPF
jgi:hypothetical protein